MVYRTDKYSAIHKKLLCHFSVATALVFLTFGTVYLVKGNYVLGGFEFLLGILQLLNILFLRCTGRENISCRFLVASVYIMSLVIFITGGLGNTGFLWVQFIPLFTMLMLTHREALVWAVSYSTILGILLLLNYAQVGFLKYSRVQVIQSFVVYLLFLYLTENNESLKDMVRKKLQEQNRELMVLSRTDGLTGLNNRAYLSQLIDREFHRFQRYGNPFSLIMLDVDHFKEVNDKFGHQRGDEVLMRIGQLFSENTRKSDAAGRWGGEEFLVLCPDTDREAAGVLAEKLRGSLESLEFGEGLSVTASFGVAQIVAGSSVHSLLSEVDRKLYISKKLGRNRVTLEEENRE
ncbi:MAG: diguanylate cyclase [Spirochaetales bacterium]|nr:diguanylate cyclase [Spirochaetales bacterium]